MQRYYSASRYEGPLTHFSYWRLCKSQSHLSHWNMMAKHYLLDCLIDFRVERCWLTVSLTQLMQYVFIYFMRVNVAICNFMAALIFLLNTSFMNDFVLSSLLLLWFKNGCFCVVQHFWSSSLRCPFFQAARRSPNFLQLSLTLLVFARLLFYNIRGQVEPYTLSERCIGNWSWVKSFKSKSKSIYDCLGCISSS